MQMHLRVLIIQAELDLNAHAYTAALDHCRHALTIEPWQEQVTLIAMKAYLALNDRPAALLLYRNLERTLREESGITPMPELRNLYQTLLG